jgi:hypothetical protein
MAAKPIATLPVESQSADRKFRVKEITTIDVDGWPPRGRQESVAPSFSAPIVAGDGDVARVSAWTMETLSGFSWACVPRAKGERVTLGAAYARYRRWREENGLSARGATQFAVDFKAIAARDGIRTRKDTTKICCLDVRLVA